MITARHFEDKMKEIAEEYETNRETRERLMMKLMADALDSLGYEAGTRIYRGSCKNGDTV